MLIMQQVLLQYVLDRKKEYMNTIQRGNMYLQEL